MAWGFLAVGGEGKPCGVADRKGVLLFHLKYFNLILCYSPLFHAFLFHTNPANHSGQQPYSQIEKLKPKLKMIEPEDEIKKAYFLFKFEGYIKGQSIYC